MNYEAIIFNETRCVMFVIKCVEINIVFFHFQNEKSNLKITYFICDSLTFVLALMGK